MDPPTSPGEVEPNIDNSSGNGGGRSLWPAMDDMRLSRLETAQLCLTSVALGIFCYVIFFTIAHGQLIASVQEASQHLIHFPVQNALVLNGTVDMFSASLPQWHIKFHTLIASIEADVNIDWKQSDPVQLVFYALYFNGLCGLLYFFVDCVYYKNRLSPRWTQIWVSLLVCIATWTILAGWLMLRAAAVEEQTRMVVLSLSNELTGLVQTPWDLQLYQTILRHWTTRCLPPTAPGLISVLGLVKLQELVHYLVYYSLPIATVLLMPVVKIVASVYTLYRPTA